MRKVKVAIVLFAVILSVNTFLLSAFASFCPGNMTGIGIEDSPCMIMNEKNFESINEGLVYSLGVNLSGVHLNRTFSGILFGNGHSISNINKSLFTKIDSGEVYDLQLLNVSIKGGENVGALAEEIISGEVSNVFISGNVSGKEYAGGLAGKILGKKVTKIEQVSFHGDVISENLYAGGVTGYGEKVFFEKVRTRGSVKAKDRVGGLVGRLFTGRIEHSLSLTQVNTTGKAFFAGGIVGLNGGKVEDSYYEGSESVNGIGLSLDEMERLFLIDQSKDLPEREIDDFEEREFEKKEFERKEQKKEIFFTNISIVEKENKTSILNKTLTGKKELLVGDDEEEGRSSFSRAKGFSAIIVANFSENVNVSGITQGVDFTEAKSFIHLEDNTGILEKSLLIPRMKNSNSVYVCPGATSLDHVNEGCKNAVILYTNKSVQGMGLSFTTIDGVDYYIVENISGTGGGELPLSIIVELTATTILSTVNDNLTCREIPDMNVTLFDWKLNGGSIAVVNMPFDGGSTSTFTEDYSDSENNGTVNGSTWNATAGYDGNGAYEFDGINDRITTTGYTGITGTQSRSIAMWTKTSSGDAPLLYWGTDSPGQKWRVWIEGDGDLVADVNGGNRTGTTNINDNAWHFIAVTLEDDGSPNADEIKLYVDGVEETYSITAAQAVNTVALNDVTIGYDLQTDTYFDGTIDNVQIYDRVLTPEQILALYNNQTDTIVSQETNAGNVWECEVTAFNSTTAITSGLSNSVTITGIQNESGYRINRGRTVITSAQQFVPLPTPVNSISSAFAMRNGYHSGSPDTAAPSTGNGIVIDQSLATVQLFNTTHIVVEREDGAGEDIYVDWQVIEALNGEFTVQRGSFAWTTELIINQTISSVNASNTMVLAYTTTAGISVENWDTTLFRGDMLDSTTVQIQRDIADAGVTGTVRWKAVEWNVSKIDSFQKGTTTVTTQPQTAPQQVTINSIDTQNSILFFQIGTTDSGLSQIGIGGRIADSTTLEFFRETNDINRNIQYYVIDFGMGRKQEATVLEDTTSEFQVDITLSSPFADNSTIIFQSATSGGAGTLFPRPIWTAELTNTTNLQLYRSRSGQPHDNPWQVLSFSGNAPPVVTLDTPAENYFNTTHQFVNLTFNATATDDIELQACSLYHNLSGTWELAQSIPVSGASDVASFTINDLTNIMFVWNVECTDVEGSSDFALANRTATLSFGVNAPPIISSIVINSSTNLTNADLSCFSQFSDVDNDTINATLNWYENATQKFTESAINILPSNYTFGSTVGSGNTTKGGVWKCEIIITDGEYNVSKNSSTLLIKNALPTHNNPILDALANSTVDHLFCFNQTTNDIDGDEVKNIYNWQVNGSSVLLVNAPFESDANNTFAQDYSGYLGYDFTPDALFDSTGGYDNKGAFFFDGVDDTFFLDDGSSTSAVFDAAFTERTVLFWYNATNISGTTHKMLFEEGGGTNGMSMYLYDDDVYVGAWSESDGFFGAFLNQSTTANDWHFVALVIDGANNRIAQYYDGVMTETFNATFIGVAAHTGDDALAYVEDNTVSHTGDIPTTSSYYGGYIDEFKVFNRSLTKEQLDVLFAGIENQIVKNETMVNETWTCSIIPDDAQDNGLEKTSNGILILPVPMYTVDPINGTYFTNPLNTSQNFSSEGVYGIQEVLIGTNTTAFSALVAINFSENINLSGMVQGINFSSSQSFIDLPPNPQIVNISLLVPNIQNSTFVVVCPNATTFSEVNDSCSGLVRLDVGEIESGLSYSFVNYAGIEYYQVANITGTGGLELQPDSAAGKDSYLRGGVNADINFGTSNQMQINWPGNDDNKRKGIIEFNISSLPSGVKVTNATLELYFFQTNNANNRTHSIHRVTNSWDELTVTWNARNATLNWTTPGGDYDHTPEDSITLTDNLGFKQWNVTSLVEGWNNGTFSNYGMIINQSGGGSHKRYRSSDWTNATQHPKLIIEWIDITPPNVTITSPANGSNVNNNDPVEINATVLDNVNVSTVYANITYGSNTDFIQLTNVSPTQYSLSFTNTSDIGLYTVQIIANDTDGVVNASESVVFTVVLSQDPLSNVILSSTLGTNFSSENLTCDFTIGGSTTDVGINWILNGTSLTAMNFPMKGGTPLAYTDISGNDNNASCTVCPTFSSTGGPFGTGSLVFNGSQFLNLSHDTSQFVGNNFSFVAWIKSTNVTGVHYILEKGQDENDSYAFVTTSDELYYEYLGESGPFQSENTIAANLQEDLWYQVAFVVNASSNGSYLTFYVNGDQVDTPIFLAEKPTDRVEDILIGRQNLGTPNEYYWQGEMAGIQMYNRDLSGEQIKTLYDFNNTIIVSDTTVLNDVWQCIVTAYNATGSNTTIASNNLTIMHQPPLITLEFPPDNHILNDPPENITFNASIVDEVSLSNCSLYHNISGTWQLNQTQAVTGLMNTTEFNVTGVNEIEFIWGIACTDVLGATTFSENRSVMINGSANIPPVVNLDTPVDSYFNDTHQFVNLTFNASVSDDAALVNCSFYHNLSGTFSLNQTQNVSGTSAAPQFNITGLTNTTFFWAIACTDNQSATTFSENRTAILSFVTPPSLASVTLNATTPNNLTIDNLTCSFVFNNTGESVGISWFVNNESYELINMPFEGNSSAELDYSGNANHPIVDANWGYDGLDDRKGYYEFDGNRYLNFGDVDEFDSPTEFTMSMWFRRSSDYDISTIQGVHFALLSQVGVTDNLVIGTDHFTDSTDIMIYLNTAGTDSMQYDAGILNDVWYHLAVTYDESATEEIKVYLNGEINQTFTQPAGGIVSSGTSPLIVGNGAVNGSNVGGWKGRIDQVRLYNRTLSPEQIFEIFDGYDTIVSNETTIGDNWTCEITPFKQQKNGSTVSSNNLEVLSLFPNVTLDYPPILFVNDTAPSLNLTFNATVTDDFGIASCDFYHNISGTWGINQTQAVTGVSNITSFNLTDLTNVSFIWNIECTDLNGQMDTGDLNHSATIRLDVDVFPTILLDIPQDNFEDVNNPLINMTFNATVLDDKAIASCDFYHNISGTWGVNQTQTVTGTSNVTEFNLTNIGGTTFIWAISCTDNATQTTFSTNRTVILNFQPVTITNVNLFSSTGTNFTDENLTCDFTLTNASLYSAVNWKVNGSRVTLLNMPFEGNDSQDFFDYGSNISSSVIGSAVVDTTNQFTGSSLRLTTAGDGLTIPDASYLEGMTNISFGGWVYPESGGIGQVYGRVLEKRDSFALRMYDFFSERRATCHIGSTVVLAPINSITLNEWNFVYCTYNGSILTIYVNNQTNTEIHNLSVTVNTENLIIGNDKEFDNTFDGSIDNLQIWNRSLSVEQVEALRQNQTNIIVSQETEVNDVWQCSVVPFSDMLGGNVTESNTLTIIEIASSCVYGGSGNFNIDCSESCNITQNYDLGGNNISIIGNGTVFITSNLTNYSDIYIEGIDTSNKCFVQAQGVVLG